MLGTLTGDSNTYTIALFSVRCSKVTLITWSKRSKVIFRAIMRAHAQVRHGSQQPMKLRDFHKYDTIDTACPKKVTLSQSSDKKAITNDAKFFIFAMPPVRRVRARRNKKSSAPSNVDTVTSLRRQCAYQHTGLRIRDYQHTDVKKWGPCRRNQVYDASALSKVVTTAAQLFLMRSRSTRQIPVQTQRPASRLSQILPQRELKQHFGCSYSL